MAASRSSLLWMSRVVLIFGVVCYLTSCTMDVGAGVDLRKQLPARGGTVGPIQVNDDGTVLNVKLRQRINSGGRSFKRWSFVTAELLDADKEYLTGFGGDFWHEAGYDEGHWNQQDSQAATKLTVPEAGRYYLRFKTEANVPTSELSTLQVSVGSKLGSSLPHRVAAILAFIIGGGLWWFARQRPAAA